MTGTVEPTTLVTASTGSLIGGNTPFFEDIVLGDRIETSSIVAEEASMIAFAREWDPMPFHVDTEAAAASIFGAITACSVYTWGLKQLLIKQVLSADAVVCMLGFTDGRLPQPLYANRSVRLLAQWTEARGSASRPDCGIVSFSVQLVTHREETVLDYIETILMRRRSHIQGL